MIRAHCAVKAPSLQVFPQFDNRSFLAGMAKLADAADLKIRRPERVVGVQVPLPENHY